MEAHSCLLIALIFLSASLHAQTVFNVSPAAADSFPRIRIPVQVVDNSGLIRTLTAGDFTVRENGVLMSPLDLDCQTAVTVDTLSVMFVLDVSRSMGFIEGTQIMDDDSVKWITAKTVTIDAIGKLRPHDYGGLISFGADVMYEHPYTLDKTILQDIVYGLAIRSGTAIYDAILLAVNASRTQRGRRVIVLMTDGSDVSSFNSLQAAINAAKAWNIPVFSIGLGVEPKDVRILDSLSRLTGGEFFLAPTASTLAEVFNKLFHSIYNNVCLLSYRTPDTCRVGGIRQLDITVDVAGVSLTQRTFYAVPDFRSHPELFVDIPPMVEDDRDHTIPVRVRGELRNESLDLDATVTFDAAQWIYLGHDETGTPLDGTPLSVIEAPPGVLRITGTRLPLTMGVPAGTTSDLLRLRMHASHQNRDVASSMTMTVHGMRQNCDMVPSAAGGTTTIRGCPDAVALSFDSTVIIAPGSEVRIPLRLHDPIDPAQDVRYSFTISYDPALLSFIGLDQRMSMSSSLRVTAIEPVPGSVRVSADGGRPSDSIGVLAVLLFRAAIRPASAVAPLEITNAVIEQSCLPVVTVTGNHVLIDGTCERVLDRLPVASVTAVSPHPALTGQQTEISYLATGTDPLYLEVVDAFGRRVAVLVDGQTVSGTQRLQWTPDGLPGGIYLLIVREGSVVSTRKLLLTK